MEETAERRIDNKDQLSFYTLSMAGLSVTCGFYAKATAEYFDKIEAVEDLALSERAVVIPDLEIGGKKTRANAYTEYNFSTAYISDHLLSYFRCIIHAAAVSFRGRAWLFAAPPGVGKSTQVRSLQKLYPGEFGVICGDRPVLELQADGTVMVHPSPWNGKENWHGAEKAPLAGILCLKRGKETSIRRWTKAEAVIPVYMSLISSRETEELIRQLSAFETELLTRVPVYEYVNGGVPDSTHYLYENLLDGGRLEGET